MARQAGAKAMEEERRKQIMFMLLEESRVLPLSSFVCLQKNKWNLLDNEEERAIRIGTIFIQDRVMLTGREAVAKNRELNNLSIYKTKMTETDLQITDFIFERCLQYPSSSRRV